MLAIVIHLNIALQHGMSQLAALAGGDFETQGVTG
jgi:hypothetical protein